MQNIDENRLKNNIFKGSLKFPVTEITDLKKYLLDSDGVAVSKVYYIERQQYVKVFYTDGAKEILYKLSPAGKCLFLFIIHHLESGKDWFILDRSLYMQKNKIKSINTVKKAITELWDANLISPTAVYPNVVYWINPQYFYCGNRPMNYPDGRVIKDSRADV